MKLQFVMDMVVLKNRCQIFFKLFFKEFPLLNSGWPLLEGARKRTYSVWLQHTNNAKPSNHHECERKCQKKSATVNAQLYRRGKNSAEKKGFLVSMAILRKKLRYKNYPSGFYYFMFAKDYFGTLKEPRVLVVIMYFLFTGRHRGKLLHT